MALPPKELYSIQDVADRWSTDVATVEDYLCSRKLNAFIRLPQKRFYKEDFKVGEKIDPESGLRVKDFGIDVPSNFRFMGGLFALIYPAIVWDKDGSKTLGLSDRVLVIPDEDEPLWLTEDITINKQDIRIMLPDIERFEAENNIILEDNNANQNIKNCLKPSNISNQTAIDDELDHRREKTLLIAIAALLEIISGKFTDKDVVKHPSFVNQAELINKIAELETRGLGVRNLQDIFADAKRAKIESKPV